MSEVRERAWDWCAAVVRDRSAGAASKVTKLSCKPNGNSNWHRSAKAGLDAAVHTPGNSRLF